MAVASSVEASTGSSNVNIRMLASISSLNDVILATMLSSISRLTMCPGLTLLRCEILLLLKSVPKDASMKA